jgi:hypothetical protein
MTNRDSYDNDALIHDLVPLYMSMQGRSGTTAPLLYAERRVPRADANRDIIGGCTIQELGLGLDHGVCRAWLDRYPLVPTSAYALNSLPCGFNRLLEVED